MGRIRRFFQSFRPTVVEGKALRLRRQAYIGAEIHYQGHDWFVVANMRSSHRPPIGYVMLERELGKQEYDPRQQEDSWYGFKGMVVRQAMRIDTFANVLRHERFLINVRQKDEYAKLTDDQINQLVIHFAARMCARSRITGRQKVRQRRRERAQQRELAAAKAAAETK